MKLRDLLHLRYGYPWVLTALLLLSSSMLAAQTEVCGNGMDDDGDGLIDCFDPDCSGVGDCEGFFFGQPDPDCNFQPPPLMQIEVELLFKTDETRFPIDQRAGVFIGDMNGDGIPDLVSRDNSPARIQIFSGDDGRILQSITTPRTHPFGQTAIADVDEDGLGDVFQVEYTGRLARYEFGNPNAVWRTGTRIGDDNDVSTPQLADINQDGTPEVYIGDRIFDAATGLRYVDGDGSVNVGGYAGGSNSDRFPIYFDLFQPGDPKPGQPGQFFGPEAAGLEYIAGNQVWAVNTTGTNWSYTLAAQFNGPTNERDGLTSIADINGDGRMDIAVMDAGRVYAWDPYTNQRIGAGFDVPNTGSGGRINIGDFDGDGDVELGFAGKNIYIVRNYVDNDGDNNPNNGTWQDLWRKTGLDDGSQRTGSTLFDFDGDGRVEVVYSEEEDLFIYDGATGNELFRTTSRSGTRTEYPLIADVNGDGTAEIIVTAQERNGPRYSGTGWISVYSSANQPWVPARQVWNQHGYNVVNVNDDLTIPQFQQNPLNSALGDRYNNFLVQTAVGGDSSFVNVYPAPDAVIDVAQNNGNVQIDYSDCPNTLTFVLQVVNDGDAPLPGSTPISFYDGNPRAVTANLINATTLGATVEPGRTQFVPVTIDLGGFVPAGQSIFISVNDPGFVAADLPFDESDFPLTGTAECDYSNNVTEVASVECVEVCDDGRDNDGDGLTDDPNLMAPRREGCPGETLPMITSDVAGGAFSIGTTINSTIDQNGVVTLGNNFTGAPVTDTVVYTDGICFDTVLVVTVDDLAPTITCPGPAEVVLGPDCTGQIGDRTALAQVADNCTTTNELVVTQAPAASAQLNLGPNPMMLTVTDQSGNQATCTVMITGVDRTDPTIVACPQDQTVSVGAACDFAIPDLTTAIVAEDNCASAGAMVYTQAPAAGTTLNGAGTRQIVRLTARDPAGNEASCTFTYTLADDTPPTITCPPDQTRDLSANCSYDLENFRGLAQTDDNCPGFVTVLQQPDNVGYIGAGPQTVTLTARDAAGNTTDCSFVVTIRDVTPPNLSCPVTVTVDADPINCAGTIGDLTVLVTAGDACPGGVTLRQNQAATATFTASSTDVTVTATDGGGNSRGCTITVRKRDVTPPTLSCPADEFLMADASCQAMLPDYTVGATSDACGNVSVVQTPGQGTTLTATTTVTLQATDAAGLVTTCTFAVGLNDTSPPTVVCPTPQTLDVDGTCTVALPDYARGAATLDNCDPAKGDVTVTQSPAPGTNYSGPGTPVAVTLTATDASGNTDDCSFTVTLQDMIAPSITCPTSPQTEPLDANCQATVPDFRGRASVSMDCSAAGLTLSQTPAPGTTVTGATITPITITATDASGNAMSCTFDFETVDEAPPTIFCPADATVAVDVNCEFSLPDYAAQAEVNDNCTMMGDLVTAQDVAAGTVLNGDGTQRTVTLTTTDAAGNAASCTLTVTLEDRTDPTVDCPGDRAETLDGNCAFVVPDYRSQATPADNCTAAGAVGLVQTPAPGTVVSGAGTTLIRIQATDAAGNLEDCTFDLVLTDDVDPVVNCPPDVVLIADGNCEGEVPNLAVQATATDNCTASGAITISQDIVSGTVLVGDGTMTTVTVMATDEAGNAATCQVAITLDDRTPPALVCPGPRDLALDPNCSVNLPDYRNLLQAADNCNPNPIIAQTPAPGTPVSGADQAVSVTFMVNDGNGNASDCSFTVTLRDESPPVITCPTPPALALDANCRIALPQYVPTSLTDACATTADLTLVQSPAAGTFLTFDGDQTTVILTATDPSGNQSNCSFTITAEDQSPPTIACPEDREETVEDDCDFVVGDYTGEATTADNCSSGPGVSVTQSPAPGTRLPGVLNQPQTITLTATDRAGQTQSCTFAVTPVDLTEPGIVCPAPQTILLDAANCRATLPDLTALVTVSDNCTAPAAITVTQDSAAGTTYTGLMTPQITVVLTAEDASGNTASCPVTVLILDREPPSLTCPPPTEIALDANCSGILPNLRDDLVTDDNCAPTALTFTQAPDTGAVYSGDGTEVDVVLTVTDGSGNTTACTARVVFEDRTPPVPIDCPDKQFLSVDGNCDVPLPDYTDALTTRDNCRAESEITVTQDPLAGTFYNTDGTIIPVTLFADDGNGNVGSCTFDVELQDRIPPELTCPGGQLVIASDDDCTGVLGDYRDLATTTDDCTVDPVTFQKTQLPAPGTPISASQLNVSQTVTITTMDASGNQNQCTFEVTLVDTLAPILTCPPTQTDTLVAGCAYTLTDFRALAMAEDNCTPVGELMLVQTPPEGVSFSGPVIDETVTINATDGSGNTASCTFLVQVRDDDEPVVSCPAPDTVNVDADCRAVIGDYRGRAVAADDCYGPEELILSQTPAPGTVVTGANVAREVTVRAADPLGNVDSCTFTVTTRDTIAPVIACPGDREVTLDPDCQTLLPDYRAAAEVSDNCTTGEAATIKQMPAPGTELMGDGNQTEVTLVADDGNGNRDTCRFLVTTIDRTPPALDCPPDTTVFLDENCAYGVADFRSLAAALDNCTAVTLEQNVGIGTTLTGDGTVRSVTITATDRRGNAAQCGFTITVEDATEPTIVCPADQVVLTDDECAAAIPDYRSLAVMDDNCTAVPDLTLTQAPAAGGMLSGEGTTRTVTLTVDDGNGNTADCRFVLTVDDTTPPRITCPAGQTVRLDENCGVTVPDFRSLAGVSDNCTAATAITVSQAASDPGGAVAGAMLTGVRTETIVLTADDGNGNTAVCSFALNVVDEIAPDLICPARSVISASTNCEVSLANYLDSVTVSDNCAALENLTRVQSPLPGTTLVGLGASEEVILTVTDPSGNQSSCTVSVELVDTTSPTLICPADTTLALDANCQARLADYTSLAAPDDNCSAGAGVTVTQSPPPGTLVDEAESPLAITLTATDASGNAETCDFTVELIDSVAPLVICPPNDTIGVDGNCVVELQNYTAAAQATDNCSDPAAITLSQSPAPLLNLSGDGTTQLVTVTATDAAGNTSDCRFNVLLRDRTAPTIACPPNQEIATGQDCRFTLPDYRELVTSGDNCSPELLTVTQSPSPDTLLADLGTTVTVTFTAEDAVGNRSDCSVFVTTVSPTPPPAPETVMLAVVEPPTGSGAVNLLDAFDASTVSNLSNLDLDRRLVAGPGPYSVGFYPTMAAAMAEGSPIDPEGFVPSAANDPVAVRIEDPASGCFTLSQVTFVRRVPGISDARSGFAYCRRAPFELSINGRARPRGQGSTVTAHRWRIVEAGGTGLTPGLVSGFDTEVITIDTRSLRSGTVVLEYQFFEDYGDGPVVASVPREVRFEVNAVGCGGFFFQGE